MNSKYLDHLRLPPDETKVLSAIVNISNKGYETDAHQPLLQTIYSGTQWEHDIEHIPRVTMTVDKIYAVVCPDTEKWTLARFLKALDRMGNLVEVEDWNDISLSPYCWECMDNEEAFIEAGVNLAELIQSQKEEYDKYMEQEKISSTEPWTSLNKSTAPTAETQGGTTKVSRYKTASPILTAIVLTVGKSIAKLCSSFPAKFSPKSN
jgi:hypothetical protein